MAKIIRVNMTDKTLSEHEVPSKYNMLGGRGLTSQIILDEVDPTCHPLGEKNKLVIAPGLLAGTRVSTSGRISIGAKSPLTGGIKESNAGGTAAIKLAKLGIKSVILEGKPKNDEWYILKIAKDEIELINAEDDLVGLGNYDTASRLKEKYGKKIAVMSIGQAGEFQMSAASVAVLDQDGIPCRHCGRGGLGAVMGSKKLKAIVIDDNEANEKLIDIQNEDAFNAINREWAKVLIVAKKGLTEFGTTALVDPINAIGGLPTKNFSKGSYESAEKINGRTLAETIKSRGGKPSHACQPGCVIRCSNVYHDKDGNYLTSSLEFETVTLFGSNIENDSLDVIAECDRKCDDYGLDTIEMGNTIAVAMEGGLEQFGDKEAPLKLLDEVAKGSVIGRVLGQGASVTGKVLGVERVPAVKGQAMAAYDPRSLKGTGVTYATSPMGADHTAGNMLPGAFGLNPNLSDGQSEGSRKRQIMATVIDTMGLCIFVGVDMPQMEYLSKLLTNAVGKEVSVDDILDIGKEVLRNEIKFNKLAGLNELHNRLPEFFKREKLAPKELVFDVKDIELDMVHNF